jgi:hypothetical protein
MESRQMSDTGIESPSFDKLLIECARIARVSAARVNTGNAKNELRIRQAIANEGARTIIVHWSVFDEQNGHSLAQRSGCPASFTLVRSGVHVIIVMDPVIGLDLRGDRATSRENRLSRRPFLIMVQDIIQR